MEARFLQVASSFTSEPLGRYLRPLLAQAGIAQDLKFAQYARMTEYLLGAPAAEDSIGLLVFIRLEDWLREEVKAPGFSFNADTAEQFRQKLRARVDEFAGQVGAFARRARPVWCLICPSAGWIAEKLKLEALCRTQSNLLITRLRSLPGVSVLSWPPALNQESFHDRGGDRLGQIPYTTEAFEQLAEFLSQQIARTDIRKPDAEQPNGSSGSTDLASYLKALQVKVRLTPVQNGDRAHVDRLLRTAAAFSLTGEKPDLVDNEVDALLEPGRCLLVSVSDRLSDYGPSGLVAFRRQGEFLAVDAMALSCPVLGKQVDFAVASALAEIASHNGAKRVAFRYKPSERNETMLAFLRSLAQSDSDHGYVVAVEQVGVRIQAAATAPGAWTLELPTYLPPRDGR